MAKKATEKQVKRTLGRDDLAAELDVHPETIGRYDREGAPHERKGRSNFYDAAEYRAWMAANGKTGKEGRPVEGDSPDLERARLRKENALAAKYELQVQRERGELVTVHEAKAMGVRAVTTFRNRLIGAGAALTPALEGRDSAERQTLIDGYNLDLLKQLEIDLQRLGEVG